MTAVTGSRWFERPTSNVLVVFLRSDIESQYVMDAMVAVAKDHALETTINGTQGLSITSSRGKKMFFEVKTGCHPVHGNLIILEYDMFSSHKVLKAVAAIVLVAVVVTASVLSGSSSSGNNSHCHHYHHHHHCDGMIDAPPLLWGYVPPISASKSITVVQSTESERVMPTPSFAFDSRTKFFEYFFNNVCSFFSVNGWIRILEPDTPPLFMHATAVASNSITDASLAFSGYHQYWINIPEPAVGSVIPTLQIDVVGDRSLAVRAMRSVPPSRLSYDVSGISMGNYSEGITIARQTNPPLVPGVWFIGVWNTGLGQLNYRLAISLFDNAEKNKTNTTVLFGELAETVSLSGEDDGWEVVPKSQLVVETAISVEDGSYNCTDPMQAMSLAVVRESLNPPSYEDSVSEDTALSMSPEVTTRDSTATASQSQKYREALVARFGDQVPSDPPDAFYCPITCDIMTDPVVAADGFSYDRDGIVSWLSEHDTSPMTHLKLTHKHLTPNHSLRILLEQWMKHMTDT